MFARTESTWISGTFGSEVPKLVVRKLSPAPNTMTQSAWSAMRRAIESENRPYSSGMALPNRVPIWCAHCGLRNRMGPSLREVAQKAGAARSCSIRIPLLRPRTLFRMNDRDSLRRQVIREALSDVVGPTR